MSLLGFLAGLLERWVGHQNQGPDPPLSDPEPYDALDPFELPYPAAGAAEPQSKSPTEPPPASALGDTNETLEQEEMILLEVALEKILARCRESSLRRIQSVNTTTEREVLAVGDQLNHIVEEARSQVRESRVALKQISGGGGETDVTSLISAQSGLVSAYLESVGSLISSQNAAADKALSASSKIVELGRQISNVSFQSHLLAINASIEASRLAAAGAAFDVIAGEMSRLSQEVAAANKMVAELAEGLQSTLPLIAEQARAVRLRSEQLSGDLGKQLQTIHAATHGLQELVKHALSSGDRRLDTILSRSHAALSHLQFQDPCAQNLLVIDAEIEQGSGQVVHALRQSGHSHETVGASVLEGTRVRSHKDLNAGHVMIFDSDRRVPVAGSETRLSTGDNDTYPSVKPGRPMLF